MIRNFPARRWPALLPLGAVALVAPVLPAAPVVAATPAPVWTVDQPASSIRFQSSEGGAAFVGSFRRWNAAIRFDPHNLAGSSVTVTVDMASATAGSAERDQALPGSDWFDTARFARATFTATRFQDLGNGRFRAMGTLTLRGVSRPLPLDFALRIDGARARMTGTTTIDRHVFGVGQGQFAGAETVPFAVKVAIALSARRG